MTRATPLLVFVALIALVGVSLHRATATTYAHGQTIWFANRMIDTGDVVNGDLNIVFGSATCGDGALIRGDVRTYFGQFTQLDGCDVEGEVQNLAPSSALAMLPWSSLDWGNRDLIEENQRALGYFAWAVLVLFAFLLFPVRVRVALERVERHPGLSAATGTLAAVAIVPVAILLLMSVIGIPLIVVEVAAVLAGVWIGQAAVAIIIGRRLFELLRPQATPTPLGALVLGLVVVVAAQMLPMFGWVVTALVWLIGFGAVILGLVRESSFASFTEQPQQQPPIGGTPMRTP
jgi:hypothetical protein